jgi:hypothetical protein
MAKEHNIVGYINAQLVANQFSAGRFQKGSFDAIAELILTEEGETKPGVVDQYGDVTYCGIDDTKPFQVYHRVIRPAAQWGLEQDFGNLKNISETTDMLMVVIGNRNKLQLTAEDIKTGIVAALPLELPDSQLNSLGLKTANIIPGNFNWDKIEVYRREFNLQKIELNTNTIIFSFSYQIETVYDQSCFTLCD